MPKVGKDSETLELVLRTLKDVERSLITEEKRLEWDEHDVLPEDVIRTMLGPEVGLHLLFLPESCGGLGGTARDIYRVAEEMAKIDLGVATAFLAIVLGSDPIRVGATSAQQERWLGRIAEEGLIVAYGVTEPEAGSNVAALRTVAEPIQTPDGKSAYRINGTKQFISNGAVADLFSILAKTPGGPSFFVIERGSPGLSVGHVEQKHGIRSSNTAQVILEDVEVPADHLVGLEEGKGLEQANEVFGFTRLMVAAFGLGGGESAVTRAVAYAQERKQFGKPLSELKGYAHKLLLPHVVRLEAARSYIDEIAQQLDASEGGLQTEGAIAKLFATEAGNAAAEAAIQAHGGYGYTREYHVEKIKRDVRITTIYEGTSEILQSIIYLYRFRQVVRSKGAFYRDMAPALRDLGDDVAGPLVARTAEALATALLTFHKQKVTASPSAPFTLADRIADVELAAAFCRRAAASGEPALAAAARLFAAEVASRFALSTVRLAAASAAMSDDALAEYRAAIDFDALTGTRVGSEADARLVIDWLLESY